MSDEENKEEIKQNDNQSEKDEDILKNLNLSINDKKLDNDEENEDKKEENTKYIKRYKSDSRLYGITFQSSVESDIINFAISSLNISKDNNISLLSFKQEEVNDEDEEESKKEDKEDINQNNIEEPDEGMIKLKSQVKCEFPVSSILFSPHEQNKNLLISTSDLLNLYSYEDEQLNLKVALKRKYKDYCGPFTSCDWSRANNAIIGVSSVDKTCSIYDLNKSEEKYMIIAHDKEVYDISLGQDEFIFMSTGADGSVRLFDSRQANSSSIIFETNNESAMTRLKWNLVNPNFILIVTVDKNIIYILDQRKLSYPYAVLKVHKDVVNNAIWAPQSNTNLISVSDDKSALIWDIYSDDSNKPEEYIMEYKAENEIENVAWGDITQNWIGLIDGNQAEVLRIQ
jgi:WD repeat-containing protein 68